MYAWACFQGDHIGEFLPIVRLLILGSFVKVTEVYTKKILGTFLPWYKLCIKLDQHMGSATFWAFLVTLTCESRKWHFFWVLAEVKLQPNHRKASLFKQAPLDCLLHNGRVAAICYAFRLFDTYLWNYCFSIFRWKKVFFYLHMNEIALLIRGKVLAHLCNFCC
jgi:hypothetical protein